MSLSLCVYVCTRLSPRSLPIVCYQSAGGAVQCTFVVIYTVSHRLFVLCYRRRRCGRGTAVVLPWRAPAPRRHRPSGPAGGGRAAADAGGVRGRVPLRAARAGE